MRRIVTTAAAEQPEPVRARRRHRLLPWLLVVLVLELAAGAGLYWKNRVVVRYESVPRIVGLQAGTARALLGRAGLYPELVGEQYSSSVPAGQVLSQRPARGSRVRDGSVVKMAISRGRHPTVVPHLAGANEAAAKAALSAAHLVGHFFFHYNETAPVGQVIGERSVAGPRVYYGDVVDIVVSKGPRPRTIPADLTGGVVNWAQAETALGDLGLSAVQDPQYSTSIPAGYVVTTKPSPGTTVPGHSSVTVVVSLGPPYVRVPPLFGGLDLGRRAGAQLPRPQVGPVRAARGELRADRDPLPRPPGPSRPDRGPVSVLSRADTAAAPIRTGRPTAVACRPPACLERRSPSRIPF